MNEKRFDGKIERLRAPERVARLEVAQVVDLCLASSAAMTKVLDVGTGSGLFAEAFAKRGLNVAGIDANPDMIEAARQFVPTGDFRTAEAEQLPFPNASFDLLFYGLLLHESDQPLQVLREARRVARRLVSILEWPHREEPFGPPMGHRLNPKNLDALLREAGFSQVENLSLSNLVLYNLIP